MHTKPKKVPEHKHSVTVNYSSLLKGYWENDIWDIKHKSFLTYRNENKKISSRYAYFSTLPLHLKHEIKLFFLYKVKNNLVCLESYFAHISTNIGILSDFLLKYYPNKISFIYIPTDEALDNLHSFMASKNKTTHQIHMCTSILKGIFYYIKDINNIKNEYEKDIWDIRNILPKEKISVCSSKYKINFNKIPEQFKNLTKRYIKVLISTNAASTCIKTLSSISTFLLFISKKYPDWNDLKKLSRKDIEEYLIFLHQHYDNKTTSFYYAYTQSKKFIEFIKIAQYPEAPHYEVHFLFLTDDLPPQK